MNRMIKILFGVVLVAIAFIFIGCCVSGFAGVAQLESMFNSVNGNLIGNSYTINTYDNYGNKTLQTKGDKINIKGNYHTNSGEYDLTSVITINIDGHEIEGCGDTYIFEQEGVKPEVDFALEDIYSHTNGSVSDNTFVSGIVNRYKNFFGKSRIIVVKSQLGQLITAYSGDDVYWEVCDELPKTTKIMIDGKALYIHRANFQMFDKELLK